MKIELTGRSLPRFGEEYRITEVFWKLLDTFYLKIGQYILSI